MLSIRSLCRRRSRVGPVAVGALRRKFHPGLAEQSLEQLLRAADLLLESGGFGLIALDLGDLPPQDGAPHPADHLVPFPPRRGTYADRAAGSGAAVHRRKLLFFIDQAGINQAGINKTRINKMEDRAGGILRSTCLPRAIADRTGNHGGVGAIPAGSQTGSFRRDQFASKTAWAG